MKKTIKALKIAIMFLGMVAAFIACDKDFSAIDSGVLGKDNANFDTGIENFPIVAYNKKLEALQINGLSSYLLGVFNDPAYGLTTASIITQITPSSFSPDFGDNPEIDSVILSIPYFERVIDFDDDGNDIYFLDSLYGNTEASIKLSIYQNNYFLRSFDPGNPDDNQKYYSDANTGNFTENLIFNGSTPVNFDNHRGDLIFEDETFAPSNKATITKTETDTTRSEPSLRLKALDNDFWKTAILDKEDDVVLSNSSNFQNYFRGLYFKAEATTNDGSMILLNLNSTSANIIVYYSKDSTSEEDERTQSTYTLNFTGNILNTFINNYDKENLADGDNTLGDERLFLKGAEGSIAVVDLFNGLVDCDGDGEVDDDALECFKNTYRATDSDGEYIIEPTTGEFVLKRIINDAQLEIYEDRNIAVSDDDFHKYDRVYAFDVKNNIPIIDYFVDQSDNTTEPFNSKIIHLSQRDTLNKKYKIRIGQHLNNILKRDSTNTQIGLVLSTNVNYTTNAELLNNNDELTAVPAASILMPRGTILHGSNENVDDDYKMKLNIFHTQPN